MDPDDKDFELATEEINLDGKTYEVWQGGSQLPEDIGYQKFIIFVREK